MKKSAPVSHALLAGSKCPKAWQTYRTATVRPKESVLCKSISLHQRVFDVCICSALWTDVATYQFTEVSCIKKHFLPVILASSSGGWGLFLKKKNCKNQRLYLCIQFTATSGNLGHQNPSVRVRQGSRTTHLPPSTRDKNPTGIPLRRTEILVCSQGLPGLQCQTLALSFSPPTEEPWVSVLLILAARQI